MTKTEFEGLQTGDIVKHVASFSPSAVVVGNFGGRVTAIVCFDMTNPSEWVIVSKVNRP